MKSNRHNATPKRLLTFLLAALAFCITIAHGEQLLPPANGQPGDFAVRQAGREVQASIRIAVTNESIYRITYSNLVHAGVSSSQLDGSMFRMFCHSQEVAVYVSSATAWAGDDFLLFHGQGFNGAYSKTNAYWLGFGSGGLRMQQVNAQPQPLWPLVTTDVHTVHHQREYYYRHDYLPNDDSFNHWFSSELYQGATTNIMIHTPTPQPNATGTLSFTVYGFSSTNGISPDHCTRVSINGSTVANGFYDGQTAFSCETNFNTSVLTGTNQVGFIQVLQPSVPYDYAYLKKFSLTYTRQLVAFNDELFFNTAAGSNRYQASGFSAVSNLWTFDVCDPCNTRLLLNAATTNSTDCILSVDSISTGRVAVLSEQQFKSPSAINPVHFRQLGATNHQADFVVICPDDFHPDVYRTLKRRHVQGLSVAVAPLADIYNEFGYGVTDAAAIKQFLGYAFHHWADPPPQYVYFAGTGSFDPLRNRYTAPDLIPVHMGPSPFKWTASDGWYVQVSGTDAVPDIVLGRLPVENETQLGAILDKCIALEDTPTNAWQRDEGLLVADGYDSTNYYDFKAASLALQTNCAPFDSLFTPPVYLDDSSAAVCRSAIQSTINDGVLAVNYFGHGSSIQWSGAPMYTTTLAASLTNRFYPITAMVTCQNGQFYNAEDCLAEALLKHANKGASACLASTGLLSLPAGEIIANAFFDSLLNDKAEHVGDALGEAYIALAEDMGFQASELSFFQLFGDPAMEVNPQP